MTTLSAALNAGTHRLGQAQVEAPRLEARLLLQWASGLDTARLISHPDMVLPCDQSDRFDQAIADRSSGCPVARIVGEKEFWGLVFYLSGETLVPRPETETIVEAVLRRIGKRQQDWCGTICDLGTGSGAILVSLLSELPTATGVGVDTSADAIATALRNGKRHGVNGRAKWMEGDYADTPQNRFDIVVSNPPYIAAGEFTVLSREVRNHDPRRALDGGHDGLDAYRILAGRLPDLLKPDGIAALELGFGQAETVSALIIDVGLQPISITPDLAGIPRVLLCGTP